MCVFLPFAAHTHTHAHTLFQAHSSAVPRYSRSRTRTSKRNHPKTCAAETETHLREHNVICRAYTIFRGGFAVVDNDEVKCDFAIFRIVSQHGMTRHINVNAEVIATLSASDTVLRVCEEGRRGRGCFVCKM